MRQVAEGVVIPDDIDDASNGQLDASMLVSFRGQWQLHRFAAPLFEAFFDAAKRDDGDVDFRPDFGGCRQMRIFNMRNI